MLKDSIHRSNYEEGAPRLWGKTLVLPSVYLNNQGLNPAFDDYWNENFYGRQLLAYPKLEPRSELT